MMPGETGKVMSDGRKISLKLLEVRDDAVLVRVEGEEQPRRLALTAK
jgi:hypothetical protein